MSRSDVALQHWQHYEALYDAAPAGYVADVLPTTQAVWFAASDGLFRFDRATEAWRRYGQREGLPGEEALALAPARDGVWVGTRSGLVGISDAGELRQGPLLQGLRVNGLIRASDTLWIATDMGAWILPGGAEEAVRLPGADTRPELQQRVLAIWPAYREILLLAEQALFRYDGADWAGPVEAGMVGALGRLYRMVMAEDQLWLAGERGLLRWDRELDSWTLYRTGQDIHEGPVQHVLPAGDKVWVATPGGAMRLYWRR